MHWDSTHFPQDDGALWMAESWDSAFQQVRKGAEAEPLLQVGTCWELLEMG